MSKLDIESEVKKDIIPLKVNKKLYNRLIVKHFIWAVIYYLLLAIAIYSENRINFFSRVFSILLGSNAFLAKIIYYSFMIIGFIFHLIIGIYSEVAYHKLDDWHKSAYKLNKILDLPAYICNCFTILLFIIMFIISPCSVSGSSMDYTLHDGDKLLSSDLFYTPKHDDIVIFDSSNYVTKSDDLYIKRVCAVEGDIISYTDNKLYVNGVAVETISEAEYLIIYSSCNFEYSATSFTVPKDKLLVLGDNRKYSKDSRSFGLINESDIFGRVLCRIYPATKIVEDRRS